MTDKAKTLAVAVYSCADCLLLKESGLGYECDHPEGGPDIIASIFDVPPSRCPLRRLPLLIRVAEGA